MKSGKITAPSELVQDLAVQIVDFLVQNHAQIGDRAKELDLVEHLKVSRTPVRRALAYLAETKVLQVRKGGGYIVGSGLNHSGGPAVRPINKGDDILFLRIAQDRNAGRIPDIVSEADLIRRYEVSRATVLRILQKLRQIEIIEKRPGKGWEFRPMIQDRAARAESFDYRLILEASILRHPGFHLEPEWIAKMVGEHQEFIDCEWSGPLSIRLFEMNAEFHLGLARATQNRFLIGAIQQQNDLRRFLNYDWVHGAGRAVESCREHLGILAKIQEGDMEAAAQLQVAHLSTARDLVRPDI